MSRFTRLWSLVKLAPRVPTKRFRVRLFEAAIFCLIGSFVLVYQIFFAWWFDPLTDRYFERKLKDQVRHDLAFLFDEEGARFVPNAGSSKSATVVTLETSDLRFNVTRHHGDQIFGVAPKHSPEQWEQVTSILQAIDGNYPISRAKDMPSLDRNLIEIGLLLRPKLPQVKEAFSERHNSEVAARIDKD